MLSSSQMITLSKDHVGWLVLKVEQYISKIGKQGFRLQCDANESTDVRSVCGLAQEYLNMYFLYLYTYMAVKVTYLLIFLCMW